MVFLPNNAQYDELCLFWIFICEQKWRNNETVNIECSNNLEFPLARIIPYICDINDINIHIKADRRITFMTDVTSLFILHILLFIDGIIKSFGGISWAIERKVCAKCKSENTTITILIGCATL